MSTCMCKMQGTQGRESEDSFRTVYVTMERGLLELILCGQIKVKGEKERNKKRVIILHLFSGGQAQQVRTMHM